MKILHVFYQSFPKISGASRRNMDILYSQNELGIDVVALTSPFMNDLTTSKIDYIFGIKHYRSNSSIFTSKITDKPSGLIVRFIKFFTIFFFYSRLYKIVRKERPDIIHAHSMLFCGLPSLFISKWLKIPFIYEVRSIWYIKNSENKDSKKLSFIQKIIYKLELFVINKATHVVFINDEIKDYYLKSKSNENISIILNAVNLSLVNKSKDLTYPQNSKPFTIGYLGTLTYYEGLDFLINTISNNFKSEDVQLYIYGDGISKGDILKKIQRLNNTNVYYKGSITPEEREKTFQTIDLIINPRIKNKLTDSVTPLKPIEAIAFRTLFLGSDVGGIRKVLEGFDEAQFFNAGDTDSLIKNIKRLKSLTEHEKKSLIEKGYNFVEKNRSWQSNAQHYKTIYTQYHIND